MEPRTCERCGGNLAPSYRVSATYWTKRRFCSRDCTLAGTRGQPRSTRGRARTNLSGRFWSKVDKRGADECWPWRGSLGRQGYGVLGATMGHGVLRAHRVAYELHFGPVPTGLVVCHHCDNPPCVNPAHLFAGTRGDNNRDRSSKCRGRESRPENRGELSPNAKLSFADVVAIRAAVAAGETQQSVADRWDIRQGHVSRIVRRTSWARAE